MKPELLSRWGKEIVVGLKRQQLHKNKQRRRLLKRKINQKCYRILEYCPLEIFLFICIHAAEL